MIVDAFNGLLRTLVASYSQMFSAVSPRLGFVLMSIVIGIAMLWVVGKTSNQPAIERAKKLMQAHLLEMRLFGDDPGLLLSAQKNLILSNFKYVGHMFRPALFLALPMLILYGHLDAVYGRRPLRVGETALVTARLALSSELLVLSASGGATVETAAVRVQPASEVSWRMRAIENGAVELTLKSTGVELQKTALAGARFEYVSQRRSGSWWERLLLAPGENGYESAGVEWLEVQYPATEIGFGPITTHWVVWFLLISIVTAYLLKGFFGVVL